MANKSLSILIIFVLVCASLMIRAPKAEAQLLGLGNILGGLGNLLGLISIRGTVFCTANGNMGINGTSTPVFPNALVQLRCGNNVVTSVTTNNAGIFSILLDPLQFVLSTLLSNCRIAVTSPLSNCNSSLPSLGGLISPVLQLAGNTLAGILTIVNLTPAAFIFSNILT